MDQPFETTDIVPMVTPESWQAFLYARPRPVESKRVTDQQGNLLDSQMLQFLNSSSENSWSLRIDSGQRLWLHQTAELLGMQSCSEGYHAKHDLRTISITKTADTELPANIQEAL